MPNTALNRTTQVLLTNKSGGALVYGDVVVLDNTNTNGFTTTTTAGLSTRGLGIILEPNGIANNASGMVAVGGWAPKCNLNTAAAVGQFIKTHTVAGQGTPHASPQVEGDFAVALSASATPAVMLFGSPNGPTSSGGSGTVTNTGTLTATKTILGNGGVDVTVSALTAQFVGSSSGTEAAASMTTARLLGRTTASSGAVEELTAGSRLTLSAGSLQALGRAAQVANFQTSAKVTGSTVLPLDDTIPQNSEGDEYLTVTITPLNASSTLKISASWMGTAAATSFISMALFQDSTAGALAADSTYQATGGGTIQFTLEHYMTAGTTSATTFKIRVGPEGSRTLFMNGLNNNTRLFGGVASSSITVTEYLP